MQWIKTIDHARITTSWENVIFALNQILCNFVFLCIN